MADIFISYARDDRSKAHLLAEAFKRRNWSVWWDTRLQAGEVWDEVIEHELNNAHCLVVLWSKTSVARRWVRAEANEGLQRGILVPVLLEHVRPPLAFRLVQAESLLGWSGEPSHSGLDRLLAAIEHVLGQEEQRRVGFEHLDQALEKSQGCKNGAFQYVSAGSKADARDRITRGAAPETKGARNLRRAALGEGFKLLGVLGWLSLASGLLCSLSISLAYFLRHRYDTNAVNILFRAALVLSLCSIILFFVRAYPFESGGHKGLRRDIDPAGMFA